MKTQSYNLDAKTLFFDIETTPTKGWSYKKWKTNLFDIEEDWHMQSFAYKWGNEKTVHCVSLPDFKKLYKKEPHNDYEVVKALYELFLKADIIVGHNGDKFDIRKAKTRFLVHRLDPPRPFKTVDTLKVAKKFGFIANSLDEVCRQLELGRKVEVGAHDLWKKCYDGDMKAWGLMVKYNKHDVTLLELLYRRFLPWINPFPRVRMDNGKCPKCGDSNFKKNGLKFTRTTQTQRYTCLTCGDPNIYGEPQRLGWEIT